MGWGRVWCACVCIVQGCHRRALYDKGKTGWPDPPTLHRAESLNRSTNNTEQSSTHTKTHNCVYSRLSFCQGQSHYSLASSAQLTINWTEHWWVLLTPRVSMATTLSRAEPMSRPLQNPMGVHCDTEHSKQGRWHLWYTRQQNTLGMMNRLLINVFFFNW